jgi:hypothetical protein
MAALGAIGVATAYALGQRRKRKEEEARQAAEAAAEAARRNAAEEARKVRNWLQGQALLRSALEGGGLSEEEKARVREEARRRGVGAAFGLLSGMVQAVREWAWGAYRATEAKLRRMEEGEEGPSSGEQRHPSFRRFPYPDPETADISEAERRRAYLASAEYQERRQKLVEWEQRQRAQAAYKRYRQGEWAEPPKTPTPTATPTPVNPAVPSPTLPPPQTPPPTATPAPMKTPLPDPFPPSPVPACTLPPTPQITIGASPEKFVVTKGIVLKGGPGSPISYARSAEETYTGHSYGGNAPAADRIGLLNDILVWIRDNTPLLDRVFPPEVNGVIFYQPKVFEPVIAPEPPPGFPRNPFLPQPGSVLIPGGTGISITGVQIENHGWEVLGIQSVRVDLHPVNSNQSYRSILAYPFDYPIITSSEFNVVQPGDIFRLHIDPVDVPPESAAKVTIHVRSESGRYGSIVQEIVP